MAPAGTTGVAVAAISLAVFSYLFFSYRTQMAQAHLPEKKKKRGSSKSGLIDAVGNTPLISINSLSDATCCEILGKWEFLNPGGSVKDRVAVKIIEEALGSG